MSKFKLSLNINKIRKQIPKIMASSALFGVRAIKKEIHRLGLIKTGAMLKSVSSKHGKTYVKFKVGADYAQYLNAGIRRHKMTSLTSAVGPIPFKKRGQFKFKTAPNAKSKFRWVHPGFKKAKGFITRCRTKILNDIASKVAKLELS